MKKNNKGFTLAELLIVVAIIAVLVAIAIPIFTTQLERAREATDLSNIRAAYAEAMTDYLSKGADKTATASAVVSKVAQQESGWAIGADKAVLNTRVNGSESAVSVTANTPGGWTVTVASGSVTVAEGAATTPGN